MATTKYNIESFILELIKEQQEKIEELRKEIEDYNKEQAYVLHHRYSASRDILYRVLTGYDNTYDKVQKKQLLKQQKK